ncbi:MAG: hypothetical protein IT434_16280 [Phycisphaerales bacterium]|jgi:hypothetical protein|nr:hypothetical protein [Phycisphaerales bacterium]
MRTITSIFMCLVCGGPSDYSIASPPTESDVRAWLGSEAKSAPSLRDAEGKLFRWHAEYFYVPPLSQVQQLRDEVKDKPEHPKRRVLDRYEKRLKDGPLIDPISCYYIDSKTWRIVDDLAEAVEPGYFMDSAHTPSESWVWQPRRLVRMNADPDSNLPIPIPSAIQGDFVNMYSLCVMGPLSGLAKEDLWKTASIKIEGSRRVLITTTRKARVPGGESTNTGYVEVEWDETTGTGRPTRCWNTYDPPVKGLSTPQVQFAAWRFDDVLHRNVVSRVVLEDTVADTSMTDPVYAIVFDSTEVIPDEIASEVVKPPTKDRPDVVRGQIAAGMDDQDFRGRSLNSSAAEEVLVRGSRTASKSWIEQLLSWAGLGAIVVVPVLVWFLMKRRAL